VANGSVAHNASHLGLVRGVGQSYNRVSEALLVEQEIIDTMVSKADCFLAKTSDAREYFHLIAGLQ
jgi:hypothetical protein